MTEIITTENLIERIDMSVTQTEIGSIITELKRTCPDIENRIYSSKADFFIRISRAMRRSGRIESIVQSEFERRAKLMLVLLNTSDRSTAAIINETKCLPVEWSGV